LSSIGLPVQVATTCGLGAITAGTGTPTSGRRAAGTGGRGRMRYGWLPATFTGTMAMCLSKAAGGKYLNITRT
jgi:hypothetical protein